MRELFGIEHMLDPVSAPINKSRIEICLSEQEDFPEPMLSRRVQSEPMARSTRRVMRFLLSNFPQRLSLKTLHSNSAPRLMAKRMLSHAAVKRSKFLVVISIASISSLLHPPAM